MLDRTSGRPEGPGLPGKIPHLDSWFRDVTGFVSAPEGSCYQIAVVASFMHLNVTHAGAGAGGGAGAGAFLVCFLSFVRSFVCLSIQLGFDRPSTFISSTMMESIDGLVSVCERTVLVTCLLKHMTSLRV